MPNQPAATIEQLITQLAWQAEMGVDEAFLGADALAMPKVVTGVFKGILLFMLLAGETFNRFDVRITLPHRAGEEASDA